MPTRKNRPAQFNLAVRNNNIRAVVAIIAMDETTLARINFQPHLVLTMINKNSQLVSWLVDFLYTLPEKHRNKLFRCKYTGRSGLKILHAAGIPMQWLNPGKFTNGQSRYLTELWAVEPSDDESSYVAPSMPDDEIPPQHADITIRSLSNESPAVSPGHDSGICLLTQPATSKQLMCDQARRQYRRQDPGCVTM